MDTNASLNTFGKEFIEKVRDLTIHQYLDIKSGKMKSKQAISTTELVMSFNLEDQKSLDLIVFDVIDRMLHSTLFMFEKSKQIDISIKMKI